MNELPKKMFEFSGVAPPFPEKNARARNFSAEKRTT